MNVKSIATTTVSPVVKGTSRVLAIHRAKKHYRDQLAAEGAMLRAEDAQRAAEEKAAKEAARQVAEALALQEQQRQQQAAIDEMRKELAEFIESGNLDAERLAKLEETLSLVKDASNS